MSNEEILPSASAVVLVEQQRTIFAINSVGVTLAAVFAIVVDAGPNGITANEVFAALNRNSMVPETFGAVQKLLDLLVEEGFIASVGAAEDLHNNFYFVTEVGYIRAVGLFPGLFKPTRRSKKK